MNMPPVEHHDVAGVDHGYNIMSNATDVTQRMYDLIAGHVRRRTPMSDVDAPPGRDRTSVRGATGWD